MVIPAYRAASTIDRAVASALAQDPAPWEVIVADDGSDDGTAEVAERAGATVQRLPRGNGSIARNRGAEAASGEFLAFLDADDRWMPGKLAVHAASWRAHPDGAFIFDPSTHVDEAGLEFGEFGRGPDGPLPWTAFLDRRQWAGGSTFSVRRETYLAIGGCHEGLTMLQDVDLWVRLAAHAGPAWRVNPSRTWYTRSPGGVSRSPARVAENIARAVAGWPFASPRDRERFASLVWLNAADVTPFPASLALLRHARSRVAEPRFWRALWRSWRVR